MKTKWIKVLIIIVVIIMIFLMGLPKLSLYLQAKFLSTQQNKSETPEKYGISFERIKIKSDNRLLDSYIVIAPSDKKEKVVLIIFHGADETISNWVKVQKKLYEHGISSLVFDYSGFGISSGPASIKNLNKDAIAVYSYASSRFVDSRLYVLGFSLGNAPMLASINKFKPLPSGVIVGSAFSSLKELGKYSGRTNDLFKILAKVIPDVWNNTRAIKSNMSSLLVVHSDSDASNPLFMGKKIYLNANQPKQFVVLHGLRHNAPLSDSIDTWWIPVYEFIKSGANIDLKNTPYNKRYKP